MKAHPKRKNLALSGFTLMELIIAIGTMTILFAIGTPYTMSFYQTYALQSNRDGLVAMLKQSRGKALANMGTTKQGVAITSANIIGFEGASYATRDQSKDVLYPRNGSVAITGATELVFQLRSATTANTTFTLSTGGKQQTVNINSQGMIDW